MSTTISLSTEKSEYVTLVKNELISTWAYLITYVELFDHPDPKRMDLLLESAPGFFALVQSALLEAVFVRLARLMDREATGKLKNLSFDRLVQDGTLRAAKSFSKVKADWDHGQYAELQNYRKKVFAHNDLVTINGSTARVNTKLESCDVTKLRELFARLWAVLAEAHCEINNTAIVEPSFGSLDMHPAQVLRQLKWAVYQSRICDAEFDAGRLEDPNRQGFEFTNVGEEKPLRLVGDDARD